MSSRIFNIQSDGRLIEMHQEPFLNEDAFQVLLEKYPNLLAGDQINSQSPRRWLLVRREMGIAGEEGGANRWALDHLFLDQDGIPTLVEVKRASDTRSRREVVAQMFDYAANAVLYWSVEQAQAEYLANCEKQGIDGEQHLSDFLGDSVTTDEFWQKVKTNLHAGKIRMLFVADIIPPELRRIIEFLNGQMDPAQVLAIELKHFVGQDLKTLVPTVFGQTAEAEVRKGTGPPSKKQPLTESELQQIADDRGVGELYAALVRKLRPLFDSATTTQSNITFVQRLGTIKQAAIISLTPVISTGMRGVRYGVYADRVAEIVGTSKDQVVSLLPNRDLSPPNWGGGYTAGFADSDSSLDPLIHLFGSEKVSGTNGT